MKEETDFFALHIPSLPAVNINQVPFILQLKHTETKSKT